MLLKLLCSAAVFPYSKARENRDLSSGKPCRACMRNCIQYYSAL